MNRTMKGNAVMVPDRRGVLLTGMLLFLLPHMVGMTACCQVGAGQSTTPTRVMLNLTAEPSTSQAVNWRTDTSIDQPVVQVAPATSHPGFGQASVSITASSESVTIGKGKTVYHHAAVMTNLTPATRYAYRVGDGQHWSDWNQFRTAQQGFQPFTFVYLGDPQNDIFSLCSRVFRTAYAHAPKARFWLIPGDLVNKGDDDTIWGELFDAMGWIPRVTPIVAVPGNHEYWTGTGETEGNDRLTPLWRPHFAQPVNGPAGLEETCFSFIYQDVRFILLNGNEKLIEQAAWLEEILRTNTSRWTVVSMHQPCYPAIAERDIPELRKLFVPLYDRYGADLVLQGHDHTYARTFPLRGGKPVEEGEPGTIYTISVSGPKMYEPATGPNPIMARRGSNTELFQIIQVKEDRLIYESFDTAGELYDRFEVQKDEGSPADK